ncbi:MAG TPA: tetratricopeptide repeat protein [Holophagaceae bacterium]|nr:tetratricopeptide repeat protein [Holophagaceae bacterium]
MPDLRSAPLLLLCAAASAWQAPALKAPVPASAESAIAHLDDPRALMLKARSMQLRGGGDDPKGAAALYRKVITLLPASAEAHLRLSEALEEAKDQDGAILEAKKAAALDPRSGEALGQVASLLFRKAREDKSALPDAKKALLAATDRMPGDPQMWAFLAETAEASSDDRMAMDAWLRLGRLRPDFVPAWERASIHAWVLKDYAGRREAIMALCDREDARPGDLKLLESLAQDQMKSGFLGHAEDSYRLLAEHLPAEPAVWESLALVELRVPEYASALEHLEKAESLKPNPGTSFNIALCLMNLARLDEASARVERLMKELPASDLAEKEKLQDLCQTIYGQTLLLRAQPKALLAWMKKTPARAGAAGDLAVLRVQALIETGDFPAARSALLDGAKLYPERPFFKGAAAAPSSRKESQARLRQLDLQTTAEMWASFGQWQTCLDLLLKAKALGAAGNADMLLLEANAYDQLDRPGDNLRALREAQKLAPGNATLQNNLGYLLLDHGGDIKEAAALIEAAVKQEPGNGSFIDSLGWLRFKQGNLKDAEAQLRHAADLRPYSADVRQHLGEVLLKLEKPDEAITQWERALAFAFPGRDALEKRLDDVRAQQAKAKAAGAQDNGADDGDAGDGE